MLCNSLSADLDKNFTMQISQQVLGV